MTQAASYVLLKEGISLFSEMYFEKERRNWVKICFSG